MSILRLGRIGFTLVRLRFRKTHIMLMKCLHLVDTEIFRQAMDNLLSYEGLVYSYVGAFRRREYRIK